MIEIRNWFDNSLIYSYEGDSIKEAVEKAVSEGADLSYANLSHANLSGAYLSKANLSEADLSEANLSEANLSKANLSGAYLYGTNLSGAILSGANLSETNLSGASLSYANLYRANLSGAILYKADLSEANLSEAENSELTISRTRILPEGSLIGWKKCKNNVLVRLRIPEEAKRSHAFGRKCRAEFAEVLEVIGDTYAISEYDGTTRYEVGKRVVPDDFGADWRKECAPGIHFFITREEAEAY